MGKRFFAVLLSMVIVVYALKSDVISVYAADLNGEYEEYSEVADTVVEEVSLEEEISSAEEPLSEDETEAATEAIEEIPEVEEISAAEEISVSQGDVTETEEVEASIEVPLTAEPIESHDSVTVSENDFEEEQNIDTDVSEGNISAELLLSSNIDTPADTAGLVGSLENGAEEDENALMKSMTVSVIDANGNVTALDEGKETVMSLNDTIKVTYTFKEPLIINIPGAKINTKIEGCHVVAGQHYKVPSIPGICTRPEGYVIDVKSNDRLLGWLKIDADGNAVLEIDSSFEETEAAMGAYAGFDLSLNLIEEANGDVDRYELVFGQTSFTVRVSDFMPQGPKVSKTASDIDSEGNITWTVTLTNAEKPIEYAEGYTISDTFSEGQKFVEGSLQTAGETLTPSVNGNTVSWEYKDNTASKVTVFTYKTHVDFVAVTKDLNVDDTVTKEVSNNIKVTAPATEEYDALSVTATAESEVSKAVSKWVDKSGTDVDATGKATWTIVVRNNGFTFKNVVLHDKIVADSGVIITMDNISVKDASGNDVSFTEDTEDGTHNIHFTEDMAGDAVYTVTYDTTIQNYARYLKENHSVPRNEAWLSYEYEMYGTGEWAPVKGPGVGTDFTGAGMVAKAAVKKTAAGIDRVNHTMDWLVEINSNEQALTGVTLTDAIPAGHNFVEVKDVKIAGAEASADSYTVDASDARNVKISFGDNIEGKKASFVITTVLTDEESKIWAGNASKDYTNTVTLSSDGNDDVTDSAVQKYDSTVIVKKAGSYDYNTHIIPYTITVNLNKMPMHDVVVTDPLDSRLEYVEGSSNVAGTVYDKASNTLTFSFDSLTDETVIKFNARVKDGATFENNGKITVNNEAGLVSAEYSTATKVTAKTVIDNKVIAKKGVRNNEVIDYTIEVNAAQQNLYRSGIKEVIIQDTLGASLVLDESSVKLYEAAVNANGTLSQATLVTGAVIRTDHSGERAVLEVVIPKSGASKAYILKYTARMLKAKAKDFSNNAILKGYGDAESNKSGVEYREKDFANVDFSKYVYYISELLDEDDPTVIIPGAHFELIDPSDGNKVVDEADSDEDGEIVFVGVLEEDHEYILKETEAPEGYEIPKDLKKGITVHTKGKGYAAAQKEKENNRVYNGKPSSKPSNGGNGSGSTAAPASDSSAPVKKKTIESLSDDSSLDGKKKLAKTGGFMGTFAGYAAGLFLMAAGLFMVKGDKKKQR